MEIDLTDLDRPAPEPEERPSLGARILITLVVALLASLLVWGLLEVAFQIAELVTLP